MPSSRRRTIAQRLKRRQKHERRVAAKVARALCPPEPPPPSDDDAWRMQRQLMQMAGRSMRGPYAPGTVTVIDSVSNLWQERVDDYTRQYADATRKRAQPLRGLEERK